MWEAILCKTENNTGLSGFKQFVLFFSSISSEFWEYLSFFKLVSKFPRDLKITQGRWPLTWLAQFCSRSSHHFNYTAFIVCTDPFLKRLLTISCMVPPITPNLIWHLTQSTLT